MSVKLIKFPTALGENAVSGVQVTKANYLAIQQWLLQYLPEDQVVASFYVNKKGEESKHRVKFRTPKGQRVAQVGEWVLRHTQVAARGGKKGVYTFTVGKDDPAYVNVNTAVVEKETI